MSTICRSPSPITGQLPARVLSSKRPTQLLQQLGHVGERRAVAPARRACAASHRHAVLPGVELGLVRGRNSGARWLANDARRPGGSRRSCPAYRWVTSTGLANASLARHRVCGCVPNRHQAGAGHARRASPHSRRRARAWASGCGRSCSSISATLNCSCSGCRPPPMSARTGPASQALSSTKEPKLKLLRRVDPDAPLGCPARSSRPLALLPARCDIAEVGVEQVVRCTSRRSGAC